MAPFSLKNQRKSFCLKLSTLLETQQNLTNFGWSFYSWSLYSLTMFNLMSAFFFNTSGQLIHLTRQLLYIENNVKDKITVRQKIKRFKMNKESICAYFSLCPNSEYLGVSSYAPKKMPQTTCFAKRKAWTAAFCSYHWVEFKHCLWPLLWIVWFTTSAKWIL